MDIIKKLILHFGSINKASKALGISRQHFQIWQRAGFIPFKRGLDVQAATNNAITAMEVYEAAAKGNIK